MSAVLCNVRRAAPATLATLATHKDFLGLRPQKHSRANVTGAAPASLPQSREVAWAAPAMTNPLKRPK